MPNIIDAVSIILVCDGEIFPIKRQNFLRAFPGYWAFPGGKVDESDYSKTSSHPLVKEIPSHLWAATAREAHEELGINLEDMLWHNQISKINSVGIAVTPDFNPYRFKTYFYSIHLNSKPNFKIDTNEAEVAKWMKPREFVEMYQRGECLVVPPVLKVVKELDQDIQSQNKQIDLSFDSSHEVPMIESIYGVKQYIPLSNTLPPANRTNCFVIGKLLVDPSPKDEAEKKKLLYSIRNESLEAIFLTHHHADHHQFAPQIARELGLKILISADSRRRIEAYDKNYFSDLEVHCISDSTQVTDWLRQKVFALAVPGHDKGQLALMPENKAWFLAGDLFQGVGTVVIGDDEGDMREYFDTLEKVIALAPQVVFPSHGIGLGGTKILERTLTHRKMREAQILDLLKLQMGEDEILKTLYSDIDERLLEYASKNIRSHIKKLKEDKLL